MATSLNQQQIEQGYESTQAHLLDELDRIDTVLDSYEATMSTEAEDGDPVASDPSASFALPEDSRQEVADRAADIEDRCVQTDDVRLRLQVLAENFGLSRQQLDVFLLALAPRLDDSYARQFRRLQDYTALSKLTIILVEKLFSSTPAERLAAGTLLGSDSPLRQHGLLTVEQPPDGYPSDRGRMFTVADHIVEYLRGDDSVDPTLETALHDHGDEDAFKLRDADISLADLRIDTDLRETLTPLADGGNQPTRCYWHGLEGTGKHRAVAAVADSESYLQADLRAVLTGDALDRLYRETALLDCPLHLTHATAALEANPRLTLEAVFDRFADLDVDIFLTGSEAWTPSGTMATDVDAIVEFPYPSIELRQQFWASHTDQLPAEIDPETLAGTFTLTQSELDAALSTARSLAGGDELTVEDVYDGCRAQSAEELDELAQHIESEHTWDDIQLREDTMDDLQLIRRHIIEQARLTGDWGFEDGSTRGAGVVSLLSGPSGTGKTLAAEILANDVGMDLYKIDLSSVVSKYIGETEENLEGIFDAAENSNAILLFDEADAVFGDRAEVSDATDRYANAEVNYLLQRIEAYDGVVLMTTNYESNIDSAFERRTDHRVSFSRPQDETREAIWRNIFPKAAPRGDIDCEFLSTFKFTGGQIKTIAQTAAILATDDDSITMEHVVAAIERQFDKDNMMFDPNDFDGYRQLLSINTTTADTTQTEQTDTAESDSAETTEIDPADTAETAETDTTETDSAKTASAETAEMELTDTAAAEATETVDSDSTETAAIESAEPDSSEITSADAADTAETDTDSGETEAEESTDSPDPANSKRDPEEFIELFFNAFTEGDQATIQELYHSNALAPEITYERLRKLSSGNLSILSPFERIETEDDRVRIHFVQQLNATSEIIECDLRLDDGSWRLFNFGKVHGSPLSKYDYL